MGAPKLKVIPKNKKASTSNKGACQLSFEQKMKLEEDKKYIKVYIDKIKQKVKSDKETQKKAALIIESLLKKSK